MIFDGYFLTLWRRCRFRYGVVAVAQSDGFRFPFSRQGRMNRNEIDLNKVVAEQEKALRQLLGDGVSLQFSLAAKPAPIEVENHIVGQILTALLDRARQALPGGGAVAVAVEHIEVDDTHARMQPGARCGKFIRLTVSDNGAALRLEEVHRLLAELPTNRSGRGLALPLIAGIVARRYGWIEAVSQEGCGTVLSVYLPVVAMEAEETPPPASETILLVDDEAPIRRMVKTVLEQACYHVIEAETGVQALSIWESNKHHVQLLLTDMIMPEGVTGRDLARQLRQSKPGLNVIYTSGYELDAEASRDTQEGGVRFLQKPYDARKLLETVHLAMIAKKAVVEEGRGAALLV
ncbi:MAG: response regulator [Verrucomicrobiota bacterium]